MARATFYTHVREPEQFACRLTQKAYCTGSRVLLWLADEPALQHFDALLWSFSASSFVPHIVWLPETPQPAIEQGVALACGPSLPAVDADTVVLNLADVYWCEAPQQPQRVLELVSDDLDGLAAARLRFRAYQAAGFSIEHHSRQHKSN